MRKVLGGGMDKQALLLLLAVAFKNMNNQISLDPDNAQKLADGINQIDDLSIDYDKVKQHFIF